MIPFIKMNGSGNDFVIFDGRQEAISLTPEQVRAIADRSNPVTKGCDQVIVAETSREANVFMRIYNADGSEVNACGNATRCMVHLMEKELGKMPVTIQTKAGILEGVDKIAFEGGGLVLVDMGKPRLAWQEIPLAMPLEEITKKVLERYSQLGKPSFVNMGNPHVVFFHEFNPKGALANPNSLNGIDIQNIGPSLERDTELFPERINVSVVNFYLHQYEPEASGYRIVAKVWERGAGITKACGTAACAMLVAANQHNPDVRRITVEFANSGEEVNVLLDEDNHVLLGGLIKEEFEGTLDPVNLGLKL